MGSALMGSLQFSCFLTEGLFGYSRQPTFIFPKVPGHTFFPNLSKILTVAAAPLVLTPFVRNQAQPDPSQPNLPNLRKPSAWCRGLRALRDVLQALAHFTAGLIHPLNTNYSCVCLKQHEEKRNRNRNATLVATLVNATLGTSPHPMNVSSGVDLISVWRQNNSALAPGLVNVS